MIYCAGLLVVIVVASMICNMIENGRKNSWYRRVTADDIRQLGDCLNN